MKFLQAMKSRRLFFDGAMGTMLQQAGLPDGHLPDLWSLERPDAVRAIHLAYLEAGCDILKTNTFGANADKLRPHGVLVAEAVDAAVGNARAAIAQSGREAFVALDLGPTGRLLKPYGDLDFEAAVALFSETVRAGARAGADCVLIETMSDTYEMKAAVLAAKESCDLPVIATFIFDEEGKLLTGCDVPGAVALLEGLGVDALGLNCGLGPAQMAPLLDELLEYASIPLVLNPNAGLPRWEGELAYYDVSPADFAREMAELAPSVTLLGGCCGTTPAHLRAMTAACRAVPLPVPQEKERLLVSSYAGAVALSGGPVVIGERINPTGKKRLQQALRDGEMDYLLREGFAQQEAGAQILDVNVGVPGLDETALLTQVSQALQAVIALPLQLDSADPAAMEAALRRYNGKALINSVTGKRESLAAVLPLVKKYGGGLVCLTLDEAGIPETAEGRVAVARRIVEAAEAMGIPRRELLVDVLTLPVSAGADNAAVTLEALARVKAELGVKTALGVSNVSFGLPQREALNAAFFTLALGAGLDGAIINPMSRSMMDALSCYRALTGRDEQCSQYIERFSAPEGGAMPSQTAPIAQSELTLEEAVVKGLRTEAAALAARALEHADSLTIINQSLVPALDRVGAGFEAGTVYLPQLLMSAEAAKAAFAPLRERMRAGGESADGPKVLLATVKGDIHDIGKNIVKALLENYRFSVVDLGKDVPPEAIVETAIAQKIALVGLSALMTTTAPAMAETIRLLRARVPGCKVMVGGAVITEAYAAQIGADHYGRDAMSSVRFAERTLL